MSDASRGGASPMCDHYNNVILLFCYMKIRRQFPVALMVENLVVGFVEG